MQQQYFITVNWNDNLRNLSIDEQGLVTLCELISGSLPTDSNRFQLNCILNDVGSGGLYQNIGTVNSPNFQPIGGSGTPSAPVNSIQYNNSGLFFGDFQATRDPITHETVIAQTQNSGLDTAGFGLKHDIFGIPGTDGVGLLKADDLGVVGSARWVLLDPSPLGPLSKYAIVGVVDNAVTANKTQFVMLDTYAALGWADGNDTASFSAGPQQTGVFADNFDGGGNDSVNLFVDLQTGGGSQFIQGQYLDGVNSYQFTFGQNGMVFNFGNGAPGTFYGLPLADGNNGDVLTTDGIGNVTWQPGGGGGTPSLTSKQIAFGDGANLMTSSANLEWNDGSQELNLAVYSKINFGVPATFGSSVVQVDYTGSYPGIHVQRIDTGSGTNWFTVGEYDSSNGSVIQAMDNNDGIHAGNFLFVKAGSTGNGTLVDGVGGDLELYAGASTGTANGGNFEVYVTPAGGVSNNTQNAYVQRINVSGTDGVVLIGDSNNATNGWVVGIDVTTRDFIAGDIGSSNNGMVFGLDDINQLAILGGTGATSNETTFIVQDGVGFAASTGKIGGASATGLLLDYASGAFGMGDMSSVNNHTKFIVDDTNETIEGVNVGGGMFRVMSAAGSPTSFGYKALNAVTTGTGNSAFGTNAGSLITDANDNTAVGHSALFINTGGHSNTAVGTGSLVNLNDSGGSDAEYNTAIGRGSGGSTTTGSYNVFLGANSGSNVTTGTDNITIGYQANVSQAASISRVAVGRSASATADYQVMFGGTASPFNTFVVGSGDAVGTANSTDVTFRINNQSGTNEAGRNIKYQSGLGTGTGGSGEHQWFTAPADGSGSTLNTSTKVLSLDKNGNLRAYTLHNNATSQGSASQQDIRSGTWTPTITDITNVTSTTSHQGQWMRVGNVVTASVQVTIDPAGNGLTTIGISLPVASNFGTVYEASGTGHAPLTQGHGGPVTADATNNRAQYDYQETAGGSTDTHSLTFTYEVI